METLTLFKTLHFVSVALLFGGVIGLAGWLVRGRRAGNTAVFAQTFQRPGIFAWVAMFLGLAFLPFSGWWLTHLSGWPLGQTWLLGGVLLSLLGGICWLLALGRFRHLAGARSPRTLRFAIGYSVIGLVAFIAVLGLMFSKPA
jgi:uncharacterized membrane protein